MTNYAPAGRAQRSAPTGDQPMGATKGDMRTSITDDAISLVVNYRQRAAELAPRLERLSGLVSRATHQTTPAPEAATSARLALELLARHELVVAPRGALEVIDVQADAIDELLEQLRLHRREVSRLERQLEAARATTSPSRTRRTLKRGEVELRQLTSGWAGRCGFCGAPYAAGELVWWAPGRASCHDGCAESWLAEIEAELEESAA